MPPRRYRYFSRFEINPPLIQIVSLQYLFRSSLHRLADLPCRFFLPRCLQVVTREVHRSSFRRLVCPAQDYLSFLTLQIICDLCPLPDPDARISILVCDVEHTAFHFGLSGRKFVLCLFGRCPCLGTMYRTV